MNYQHKFDLVEAERCRVANDLYQALALYDQAIAGATAHSYTQEAALANELAARFYFIWHGAKPKSLQVTCKKPTTATLGGAQRQKLFT